MDEKEKEKEKSIRGFGDLSESLPKDPDIKRIDRHLPRRNRSSRRSSSGRGRRRRRQK